MKYLLFIIISCSSVLSSKAQCIDTLQFPNLQPPCFVDFVPVCGCDGVTYRNACYARFATVLQFSEGPCKQIALDFYPNPCTNWLYLTAVTKYESDVNLYIFDRNGNVYYYQYLPNVTSQTLTIPVNGFEKGLYIVMLESNGVVELSKFIRWEE